MADALDLPPQDFVRAWSTTYLAQEQGTLTTLEAVLESIRGATGDTQAGICIAVAGQLYRDFQRRTLAPRPEALPMLAFLRQADYATGLISNCPAIAADLWPESTLAPLIDVAIFSCRVGFEQADPRIYRLTCEQLGIVAERCLYVGDGGSRELSGAVACGMDAVRLQPCDEDPDDARLLGREQWGGRTIHLLSEIPGLLSQAA
jgi:putative hydrolase of the HAD superfamily